MINYNLFFKTSFFAIACIFFACNNSIIEEEKERSEVNIFWKKMESAFKDKNTDFLIENSYYRIQCGNCGIKPDSIEWFEADYLYFNHLDKIAPPLKNKSYSITQDTVNIEKTKNKKLYRINYPVSGVKNFNLIYSIIEEEQNFKFQGMFTVP